MAVTITSVSVDDLPGIERQYGEGLIIQDCDLNPYEAANLVNQTFTHGGILLERTEFQKVMVWTVGPTGPAVLICRFRSDQKATGRQPVDRWVDTRLSCKKRLDAGRQKGGSI